MDINLCFLSIQNPWWTSEQGGRKHFNMKFDPVILNYSQRSLKYQPAQLTELDFKKNQVYFLYGPRGVGKTTIVKLAIKKLIEEKNIAPDNIFYYSCRNLDSFEQLNEMIKIFLKSRDMAEELYIFIDEITQVKNWQSGLDYLVKAGKLKNTSLVLTSSIIEQANQPQIFKNFNQIMIDSLGFKDFFKLLNPNLAQKINKKNYQSFRQSLEYYLEIYFLTGGFLPAINDFKENGGVRQDVYTKFLSWLMLDIARMGRDLALARQIMEKLLLNLGQPLGYQTIARKTKAKTHLTAAEYLNLLEKMFALKIIYQADGGRPATGKAKKIYFRDPFIFWLFYSYIHGSLDYWQFSRQHLQQAKIFNHLMENIVFSHLLKNRDSEDRNRITYWRDNIKKVEINFLARRDNAVMPILVRPGQIKSEDEKIFKQAGFNKGIIINNDKLDLSRKIKIMPLTYFLLFS